MLRQPQDISVDTLQSSTCRITAQEQTPQVFQSYQVSKSSIDLTPWKFIIGKRKKEIRTGQHRQQHTWPIWQKISKSFPVLSPFILKMKKYWCTFQLLSPLIFNVSFSAPLELTPCLYIQDSFTSSLCSMYLIVSFSGKETGLERNSSVVRGFFQQELSLDYSQHVSKWFSDGAWDRQSTTSVNTSNNADLNTYKEPLPYSCQLLFQYPAVKLH